VNDLEWFGRAQFLAPENHSQLPTQITEDPKKESAEIRSNSRESAIHNAALLAARDCTVDLTESPASFCTRIPRIEADLADQGCCFNSADGCM
jgi:hypothetical protein